MIIPKSPGAGNSVRSSIVQDEGKTAATVPAAPPKHPVSPRKAPFTVQNGLPAKDHSSGAKVIRDAPSTEHRPSNPRKEYPEVDSAIVSATVKQPATSVPALPRNSVSPRAPNATRESPSMTQNSGVSSSKNQQLKSQSPTKKSGGGEDSSSRGLTHAHQTPHKSQGRRTNEEDIAVNLPSATLAASLPSKSLEESHFLPSCTPSKLSAVSSAASNADEAEGGFLPSIVAARVSPSRRPLPDGVLSARLLPRTPQPSNSHAQTPRAVTPQLPRFAQPTASSSVSPVVARSPWLGLCFLSSDAGITQPLCVVSKPRMAVRCSSAPAKRGRRYFQTKDVGFRKWM